VLKVPLNTYQITTTDHPVRVQNNKSLVDVVSCYTWIVLMCCDMWRTVVKTRLQTITKAHGEKVYSGILHCLMYVVLAFLLFFVYFV